MCEGRNLGWRFEPKNNSLISTLSWKCLTVKGTTVTQEECKDTSDQEFYFDSKTGHLGPSSSPDPVPTSCLEATAPKPGHTPSGPVRRGFRVGVATSPGRWRCLTRL
eukprot:COSAG04_NODE_9476_length_860_cov_1.206307_2_plen_106_part_01